MSHPNITDDAKLVVETEIPNTKGRVGPSFKGKSKGKINFSGKNTVTTVYDDQGLDVGASFVGEQEDKSVINYRETNALNKVLKNDNADQNVKNSSNPSSSKQKFNMNCEPMLDVGFRIKGHVTIFNQEFRGTDDFRAGSIEDVKSLKTSFRRFGMEPKFCPDQNLNEIIEEFYALSRIDFSTYKLFVCIYMSHGHRNGIVSAADRDFNFEETIINPIMRNKSLNGIAKIFILVACRGKNKYKPEYDNAMIDGRIVSTKDGIDYSKCIVSYSTYPDHVSKRTLQGTYFIQHLCDNMNNDNGTTKIHSIFAKVNDKLTEMFKQVPVFQTTMGDLSFKDLAST